MGSEGTDLDVSPWHHLEGDERRRYFWHWEDVWVGDLLGQCILELQERGVLIEVSSALPIQVVKSTST